MDHVDVDSDSIRLPPACRCGNSGPMKSLKPLGTAGGRLLSLAFSAPVEGAGPRYLMASTSGAEATLVLMNWEPWLSRLRL